MSYYIKTGVRIDIAATDAIDICEKLAPLNYMVLKDKRTDEYYLEIISDFTIPEKIYGNTHKHTARIINTFNDRAGSTGVLLTGEKGSGKTMLAKNIATKLAAISLIPTIVINECLIGDAFNKFIQSIEQSCVILFDEFEKIYTKDQQKSILTLLDGVFPTKKLFIFTCNDVYNINEHLCNRPGRIYYNIRYHGIEEVFIREYCEDRLINKSHIDQICKIAVLFAAFNFDLLQALIEEMNRYDESPGEALKILNAIPEDNARNKFDVDLTAGGIHYGPSSVEDGGSWNGNPMNPNGISIGYRKNNEAGDDWDWANISMSPSDLADIDIQAGVFTFVNRDGDRLILTKDRTKTFNFDKF